MATSKREPLKAVRFGLHAPIILLPLLAGLVITGFTIYIHGTEFNPHGAGSRYVRGWWVVVGCGPALVLLALARWWSPYLLLGAATLVVRPWGTTQAFSEEMCWGRLKGFQPNYAAPGPKGDLDDPKVIAARTLGEFQRDGHKVILRGKDGGVLTRFSLRWIRPSDRERVLHWIEERAAVCVY